VISFLVTFATVTMVFSLWIMISTITAAMTGLIPVVAALVMVVVMVAMMVVIKNRTQRDKRNGRSNDTVIMICAGRYADQCQSKQAANGHDSKLV
jgi:uncharacterized membrane protein